MTYVCVYVCVCVRVFFVVFFKERLDLEVHERIAYECFVYLWGVAVLQEDAVEIKL